MFFFYVGRRERWIESEMDILLQKYTYYLLSLAPREDDVNKQKKLAPRVMKTTTS